MVQWFLVALIIIPPSFAFGQARKELTKNEIQPYQVNLIPVIPLAVNFQFEERETQVKEFFTQELIADKIFGLTDSKRQLNAYFQWASYGQVKLSPAEGLEHSLMAQVIINLKNMRELKERYAFDSRIGIIEELGQGKKIIRFLTDSVTEMLKDSSYQSVSFQDAILILLVNIWGKEYWGRHSMGVLPGYSTYELIVGPNPKDPNSKFCLTIEPGYTYRDYYQARRQYLQTRQDQFVRGVAMFTRDGHLSCAPHDIINVMIRASAVPPKRGRAIIGLYNNYLQDIWAGDGKTNTSPYIGWWDVMADHLHIRAPRSGYPTLPSSSTTFFQSIPQGLCAYTRLLLGWIPKEYVAEVRSGSRRIVLAPLGINQLPQPKGEILLAIKVPLTPGKDRDGNLKERYYLIEARKFLANDNIVVEKSLYAGYPSYLPDRLVPKEGVLIYLVDHSKPIFGPKPEKGKVDRRNFVLVLESQRGEKDDELNDAAFTPGQIFKGEEGVRVEIGLDLSQRNNYLVHVQR